MKIVNIIGGLGNQMFDYAMFVALKMHHPEETIKLCTRSYIGYPLHNGYELGRVFNICEQEATTRELVKLAYPFFNYKTWQLMNHILPRRSSMSIGNENIPFDAKEVLHTEDIFFDGYWQNEKYFDQFRDKILKVFTFPPICDQKNIQLEKKIYQHNSVACHIRRGDYLKDQRWNVCTIGYYQAAILKIIEDVKPTLFCVFSDDIEWCKTNIEPLLKNIETVYVNWNSKGNAFRDMQMMSLCHHNIVANSSFSWWGAWLNEHSDKIVISPSQWMQDKWVNNPVPESWLKININEL
jgi:hypothetical protein